MNAETSSTQVSPKRRAWIRGLLWLARAVILALVTYGIWSTVQQARAAADDHQFNWGQIQWKWVIVSGAFYLLGMIPMWWFWDRTLRALGQSVHPLVSLRAFFAGHLGKYVPGKAMVVVIRTGLLHGGSVDRVVAATSVFIETLTMMAVGASIAAFVLLFYAEHWGLVFLAVALMLCSGIPTLPPIFRRVVRALQLRRLSAQAEDLLAGLTARLMASGWMLMAIGWVLFGLSLWAALQAVPTVAVSISDLPLLTACVGLAMVAGFLSLIPGGLGVREFVVMSLLAQPFGQTAAVVTAVLLRVVWLVTELVACGITTATGWATPERITEPTNVSSTNQVN